MCVCVCERACARARVCTRVPLSEQGERNVGAACVRECIIKRMYIPLIILK